MRFGKSKQRPSSAGRFNSLLSRIATCPPAFFGIRVNNTFGKSLSVVPARFLSTVSPWLASELRLAWAGLFNFAYSPKQGSSRSQQNITGPCILFLKGDSHGTAGKHSKGDCSPADNRCRLSGPSPGVEKFMMASLPKLVRPKSINNKLPIWMKIVKDKT